MGTRMTNLDNTFVCKDLVEKALSRNNNEIDRLLEKLGF